MPRTLILIRHAKSSWDDLTLDDHDRPLNKRGRRSAEAIGAWLKRKGWLPDEVLSSTSVRTRETWARMALDVDKVTFTGDLYHASPEETLSLLSEAKGDTVLLLGHNPGFAEFAGEIVDEAPMHARFFDFPTCATAVIRFDIDDWRDVKWHSGEAVDFVIPRELLK
ncbi:histidine phosphatase family protein [Ruegeria sediminis]|uniref:Histidine phosphatase family protein n=1 Tax=Ruegeria sediminis TaxID=2583820 RepID=A0ABY2WS71_9RHOB|nr:histidine phosphatase family protein [Ruegeria sediminis]TMV03277.1 histidine phosphatase family protein [Ruegeria sediminis]